MIAVENGNGLSVGCHVASEDPWGLKIAVPSGVRVVAHGHSVAFWCEAVQVAELHVQSTSAATVAVSETSLPSQRIELRGRGGDLRIDLRFEEFLLKDRGVGRPGLGWRRHDSERSLNYILDSPVTGQSPRKLLVVFSAIGAEYDFTFNYRASVKGNTYPKRSLWMTLAARGPTTGWTVGTIRSSMRRRGCWPSWSMSWASI